MWVLAGVLNTMPYIVPDVTLGAGENEKWTHTGFVGGVAVAVARTAPFGFPDVVACTDTVTLEVPSPLIHRSTPLRDPDWPAVKV